MTKINKSSLKFPGTLRKYSSGAKLNMFVEYTMVEEEKFRDTFGFTDEEVDELFKRYQERTENQHLTREDLLGKHNLERKFESGKYCDDRLDECASGES